MAIYLRIIGLLLVVVSGSAHSEDIRDYYAEPGLTPYKSALESLNESIDPFSGALKLSHVDLSIPGNGGLTINVTRFYNHHAEAAYTQPNYYSLYGVGWTMHFGRLVLPRGAILCADSPQVAWDNPSFELPDGSRHLLVRDTDGSGEYITHSNWRGRCDGSGQMTIISPEGTRYLMEPLPMAIVVDDAQEERSWLTSRIEDVHGNFIDIHYLTNSDNAYVYIDKITSSDGRLVDYSYNTDANGCFKLHSIAARSGTLGNDQVWTYTYDTIDGFDPDFAFCGYNLTQVTLPDQQTWEYTYYPANHSEPGRFSLQSVTNPYGATTTYSYTEVDFSITDANYPTTVVAGKTTSGPTITPGEWVYSYAPQTVPVTFASPITTVCGDIVSTGYLDQTTITTPDAVHVYQHSGAWKFESRCIIDDTIHVTWAHFLPWQIGLLNEQRTYGRSALADGSLSNDIPLEQINTYWQARKISDEWYSRGRNIEDDTGTFVPQLKQRRTLRSNGLHNTFYADYDRFGNPGTITETGGLNTVTDRVTRLTYYNDTNLWIIGRPDQETVEGVALCDAGDSTCTRAPQNLTIDRSYDPLNGDLLAEDRYGVVTQYTYHPSGDLHTVTDSRGNVTTYDSYYRGTPQTETFSDNTGGQSSRTLTRVVNDSGTVASVTNGRQFTTRFSYDSLNRLSGIDFPINAAVSVEWLANERRLTRGNYRQVDTFDGFGQIIRTDRSGGQDTITTTQTYDAVGQRVFASYPNASEGEHYVYDALGRPTQITHPDNTFQRYDYSVADYIVTVTNERNHSTKYYYRDYGSPGKERVPLMTIQSVGGTELPIYTLLEHNKLNQLIRGIQGQAENGSVVGWARRYNYDTRGFLIGEYHPEIGTKSYTRDPAGNPITSQTHTALPIHYVYDGRNRLTLIDYPDAAPSNHPALAADVSYGYDDNDNLTALTRDNITWTYSYDSNDNLLNETLGFLLDGATERLYQIAYGYDTLDALSQITYPDGLIVNYDPDALGRPRQVSGFAGGITYHPNGHLKTAALANGHTLEIALNERLFPQNLKTGTPLQAQVNLSYHYDGIGNVTDIEDHINTGNSIAALQYDQANRLIEANGPWGLGRYRYDATGNLLSRTLGSQTWTYAYSGNVLDQIEGSDTGAYDYDVFGNIIDDERYRYRYDYASQLIGLVGPEAEAEYRYDGHGQRTVVTDLTTGNRQYSLYNQAGKLLHERDLDDCRSTNYLYLGSLLLARQDQTDDETDSDGDTLSDCLEDRYGLDPADGADAGADLDHDGLTGAQEVALGTRIDDPDSDDDGVWDGAEAAAGTNPNSPLRWTVSLDSELLAAPAQGPDGTLYAATLAGTLYAIGPDGVERWRFTTGPSIVAAPTVDSDGAVYVRASNGFLNNNGTLYALNPDGSIRWQATVVAGSSSPALGSDGTLYLGSEQSPVTDPADASRLLALNPNGSTRWVYSAVVGPITSPAIATDGTIYVGANPGYTDPQAYLHAVTPSGSRRWQRIIGTGFETASAPALAADGTIYIGSDDGKVYAVDPNGTLKWSYATGAALKSSAVVAADGTIYIGSDDGYLYALHANGTLRWRYGLNSTVASTAVLGADGTIYVGSGDDHVYALHPDGTLRWRYRTDSDVDAPLLIGSDGTVYAGSLDGRLYAFSGPGGTTTHPWPMFQRDPQRRGGTDETQLPPDADSDNDGLPDDWERLHFGDLSQSGAEDFDNDGLTNAQEYAQGTDPTAPDTDPAPAAVTEFTAQPGDGQVLLTWTPVPTATQYTVYWSTQPEVTPDTGTALPEVSSPYQHTDLSNGVTYYYIVTASNPNGTSPPSVEISATPSAPNEPDPVPEAVTDFMALPGDGSVLLSWTLVPTATQYTVYWSTQPGVTPDTGLLLPVETSPYQHTGLGNGVTYYYIVTASNPNGTSPPSAERSVRPGTRSWSLPEIVTNSEAMDAGLDARGNLRIVWSEAGSTPPHIRARYHHPDSGWSGTVQLDTDSAQSAAYPTLALNPQGQAVALWVQHDGVRHNLWSSVLEQASAHWQAPRLVETYNGTYISQGEVGEVEPQSPQIILTEQGLAAAVWLQKAPYFPSGSGDGSILDRVYGSVAPGLGSWQPRQLLDNNDNGRSREPRLVARANGDVWFGWSRSICTGELLCQGTDAQTQTSRRLADGSWTLPQRVDNSDASDSVDQVGMSVDAQGQAQVIWHRETAAKRPRSEVWSSDYDPATATWSAPVQQALRRNSSALSPQTARNAEGAQVQVWLEDQQVVARYRSASGNEVPAQVISGAQTVFFIPPAVVDAEGNVLVVWWQTTATGSALGAARYREGLGWQVAAVSDLPAAAAGTIPSRLTLKGDGYGNAVLVWQDRDQQYRVSRYAVDAPVNQPPTAQAGVDQLVLAGTGVTLDGSASTDTDGVVLEYVWQQTAGPSVSLSDPYQVMLVFTAPAVSTPTVLAFTLTVRDDGGLEAHDTVTVTVAPAGADILPPHTGIALTSYKVKGKTRHDIQLSADEPATTYYRITGDGQILSGGSAGSDWQVYHQPITVELGNGPTAQARLSYYSVDRAQNQEPVQEQVLAK